jgi:hypothetical protein
MHSDGSTLAIGTANGNVQFYDLRSKFDEPFHTYQAHNTSLHCLKFLYEINTPHQQKSDDTTNKKTTSTVFNNRESTQNPRILINKSNTLNGTINQPSFNDTIMNQKDSTQYTFNNMYSPAESTQQQQQQLSSSTKQSSTATSSFILHKNYSNNNIDAITPIIGTINHGTPSIPTNGNNLGVNKVNLLLSNKNLNNLKGL